MGRISQPEMPQRAGYKQMPELVIDVRRWHRMMTKQRKSQPDRKQSENRHPEERPIPEPPWPSGESEENQNRSQPKLHQIARAEPKWLMNLHDSIYVDTENNQWTGQPTP